MKSGMPLKTILLFGAGAVACGIVSYVLYLQEGERLAVRKHGASVEGSVRRSWSNKSRRSGTKHWVEYDYAVDGVPFQSDDRRVPGPLVQGGPIKVWYDPRSPDRCVSDPELRYGRDLQGTFILGAVGISILISAVLLAFRRPPTVVRS